MSILSASDLTFGFAHPPLLQGVNFNVQRGERVGLLGRNGTGKSTLLRLVAGELKPEAGSIVFAVGTKTAYLPQDVPSELGGTVFERVADGLGEAGPAVIAYHLRGTHLEDGWEPLRRVERTLEDMKLDGEELFDTLSAGKKRRVLLARAIVGQPDLLLLDEPTNHLDVESIVWLEEYLKAFRGTSIFITHDRSFLRALATRIVEIERGRTFDFTTDYDTFLFRRDELLEAEVKAEAQFDKKLAQEEVWLRRGMKARRKRNEGRVRALMEMRVERQSRRAALGTAKLEAREADRSGQRVVKAVDVSFSYGERPILRNFSVEIGRGDRIGLIGPNGAGKTTLLRILLGELAPDTGRIELGTRREVGYFDQLLTRLDPAKSVWESVADGLEKFEVNGQPRHVLSYLGDFLFPPDRARLGVGVLSGGERNRLLLARMFAKPSNVLVLDEPTNDLDTETLELLEELLIDYPGTVFLVSHDRAFLNNVVTSVIAFEGDGAVKEYVGGYDDYVRQRAPAAKAVPTPSARPAAPPPAPAGPRKLSYKEARELEALPGRIEALEARQKELHAMMADPGWYRQGGERISAFQAELDQVERDLAAAYARWEALTF
jgi:ABC transport system ATP-binding/permease protein